MAQTPNGTHNVPIWARTSVLCNGQIAYKVKNKTELDPKEDPADPRHHYKETGDAARNLLALNGLQISRKYALSGDEILQPLAHAHECLPLPVQDRIWLGGEFGWLGHTFTSSDHDFGHMLAPKFGKETRANGQVIYSEFFQQLRSSEYLLWPVEVENGHWMAVLAHLGKTNVPNPGKAANPGNKNIPDTIPPKDYNTIRRWGVVTARRNAQAQGLKDRVRQRFAEIVKHGDFTLSDDLETELWVPEDTDNFSSGLRVYNLIKEQMHRVTEFHCREIRHQHSFWDPHPGWLNVDEVRTEMQGRAAHKCLNDLNYYARIAIEGVCPVIGIKTKVRAHKLRPKDKNKRAYVPGRVSEGRCVESGGYQSSDSEDDSTNTPEGSSSGDYPDNDSPGSGPPGSEPPGSESPGSDASDSCTLSIGNSFIGSQGKGSSYKGGSDNGSSDNGSACKKTSGKKSTGINPSDLDPSGAGINGGGSSGGEPEDLNPNTETEMESNNPQNGSSISEEEDSDESSVDTTKPDTGSPTSGPGNDDSHNGGGNDAAGGSNNPGGGNAGGGKDESSSDESDIDDAGGASNPTKGQAAEGSTQLPQPEPAPQPEQVAQPSPQTTQKKRPNEDYEDNDPTKKLKPRRFREATFLKSQEDIDEARRQLDKIFAEAFGDE